MNSEERLIGALKREPVDRIPTFEWDIDKKVIQALCPGATKEEFIYQTGLDAICVDLDYQLEDLGDGLLRDEWGQIKKFTQEGHAYPVDGPIRDAADLRGYRAPDPHAPERFLTLEKELAKHAGKKAVLLHLNDVYSIPSRLMKYEDFVCAMAAEPDFVRDLVNMTVDVQLELAAEAVKRGVKICYTGDDFAYVNGPVMSPRTFETVFFEPFRRVIRGFKSLGLYVIKHTDGNIMPIIEMIMASGIDCIDPLDRTAGMDLAYMKQHYGGRVAIKGNVDCVNSLAFGTVAQTIEDAKECIRTGGAGYGYIFSSSNSIHSSVKPENYQAMLDTHQKYGAYPIAL